MKVSLILIKKVNIIELSIILTKYNILVKYYHFIYLLQFHHIFNKCITNSQNLLSFIFNKKVCIMIHFH